MAAGCARKSKCGMLLASVFFVVCGQFFVMSISAVAAGVCMKEKASGWEITADGDTPEIAFSGSIPARSFFLMERANDDVVSAVAADLIYPYKNTGLSNSGEHIFLRDAEGVVQDEIDAASGWPAGDNTTKFTMQRAGSTWVTAAPTPKKETLAAVSPTPAPPAV